MAVTRRHSQKRPPAISEAERDAMTADYYERLRVWLSEPTDTGHPELPKELHDVRNPR